MPQTRTTTPFMAAFPGLDDRILRDVGLDAEGNVVDEHDPRIRRRAISRPLIQPMLGLLSTPGTMLPDPRRAGSRL